LEDFLCGPTAGGWGAGGRGAFGRAGACLAKLPLWRLTSATSRFVSLLAMRIHRFDKISLFLFCLINLASSRRLLRTFHFGTRRSEFGQKALHQYSTDEVLSCFSVKFSSLECD